MLPDQLDDKQKMNKIEYLLKQLRLKGEIKNESKGKESIWMLGKLKNCERFCERKNQICRERRRCHGTKGGIYT